MELELKLKKIKNASQFLKLTTVKQRNAVLKKAAQILLESEKLILKENQKDLNTLDKSAAAAFRDRLTITPVRLQQMSESLLQVAALPDPLKSTSGVRKLKNGLKLRKVKSPLGVIFMIFESRPNVAVEAFSMGFKSGNAMILRGGKESLHTVSALFRVLNQALRSAKIPEDVLWGITDSDRSLVQTLLQKKNDIDVVVPRGGEGLINYVVENSKMPIIKNDRGLCHVYVHHDADLDMAVQILVNSKTQRPSVCNSMETMLVHQKAAAKLLPQVYEAMQKYGVTWYGCPQSKKILKKHKINSATEKNWNTEYLDQIVNCKVVKDLDEALVHIRTYSSGHSESIVTRSAKAARRFQAELDSAVIYWNASTRFTDGFEFGLGGELGISTQKLHVRGPVGLDALTNERWLVEGKGQIRR